MSFSSPRPEKLVWHGSSTVGIRLTTNYCEAWRTADMAVTGQAALLQTGRLLGQHTRSCSNHYIVLCIENTYVGNIHQRRTWRPTHTYKNTHAGMLKVHTHINLSGKHMQAHARVMKTHHCIENPSDYTDKRHLCSYMHTQHKKMNTQATCTRTPQLLSCCLVYHLCQCVIQHFIMLPTIRLL